MDVIAVVALARSIEDEAPVLAAELGLTAYETAMTLRAPMPVIVFRSEDRARVLEVLGKLRGRGHEVVACTLNAVTSSDAMFTPKSFRFEGTELVATGNGEERRLPAGDVFALVRATHQTRVEDTVTNHERKLSFGRAAMSGGLLMTKVTKSESRRVVDEREAVLYVFRSDAEPWLLCSMRLRYDGLAEEMRRSRMENFEVLVRRLRENVPAAPYDARLLAVRASTTVVTAGSKHLSASSAAQLDVLAHLVALSLGRANRPYR